MDLSTTVRAYRDDIADSLSRLVQIPSLKEAAEPGRPFGKPIGEAMDFVVALAQRLGLATAMCDGYAVHAEATAGPVVMGILSHLDVVPAGDGWSYPPFCGEIRDGNVLGRGAMDDKAGAIASLYALKAVLDCGIPLTDTVRLIFGGDEESGMEDMTHYSKVMPMPDYGFSPDAGFPVVFAEKGILGLDLVAAFSGATNLVRVEGGTRSNVVPHLATALIAPTPALDEVRLAEALRDHVARTGAEIALDRDGENMRVTSTGISAHAAGPSAGRNAIGQLALFLKEIGAGDDAQRKAIALLAERLGMEYDGARMGVAMADDVSGPLTLNLGVIDMDARSMRAQINIRYPVTKRHEDVVSGLRAAASSYGVSIEGIGNSDPLYLPDGHPVLTGLMKVYRDLTGDETPPQAIGGGTYARCMPNACAFGPGFPFRTSGGPAHQRDEYAVIDAIVEAAVVYAHAIAELAGPGVRLA